MTYQHQLHCFTAIDKYSQIIARCSRPSVLWILWFRTNYYFHILFFTYSIVGKYVIFNAACFYKWVTEPFTWPIWLKALINLETIQLTVYMSESLNHLLNLFHLLIQQLIKWLCFWVSVWIIYSNNLLKRTDSFRNKTSDCFKSELWNYSLKQFIQERNTTSVSCSETSKG